MAGKIKAKAFPRRQPGVMNKLEERFWGMAVDFASSAIPLPGTQIIPLQMVFERHTLKLANGCRYTPDFKVIDREGHIWFIETKGFWQEDARVKIKVAAEQFWEYRFLAAQWKKSTGWTFEEFGV